MRMIEIAKDLNDLNRRAAEHFVQIAGDAVADHSLMTVSLAGGSTPRSLYGLLASNSYRDRVDWQKVYFFFGDERCVPPDSRESNYRMAKESLLDPLNIAPANVFRWETELNEPAETAARYERAISDFFSTHYPDPMQPRIPRFDLVLLGMGPDGHTASLFPFSPALSENERLATENWVEKLEAFRVTLTFPVLNHAANVIFLAAGSEKADTLAEVLEGEFDPDKLPSQEVEPLEGRLIWLVDEAAAVRLTQTGI